MPTSDSGRHLIGRRLPSGEHPVVAPDRRRWLVLAIVAAAVLVLVTVLVLSGSSAPKVPTRLF